MYKGFHNRVEVSGSICFLDGVAYTVKKVAKTAGVLGFTYHNPQVYTPQWQSDQLLVKIDDDGVMTIYAVPITAEADAIMSQALAKPDFDTTAAVEKLVRARFRELLGLLESNTAPKVESGLDDLRKLVDSQLSPVEWTAMALQNVDRRLEVRCDENHAHTAPGCVVGDVRDVVIAVLCRQIMKERKAVRSAFELQGIDL